MQQLSEQGLVPEAWGGDTVMVEVSALQNLGIDDLLENLLVVAELEDLRADPDGRARGVVLESQPRHRPGPGRHHPRAARHPQGRRPARRRRRLGPGPGPHQRQGRAGQGGRPVDAGRRCSACPTSPTPATASWSPPTRRRPPRSPPPASTGSGSRSSAARPHAMSGGAKLEDIFEQIQAGEAATLNLIAQGRRHRLARGAHREPPQAGARRGQAGLRAPGRRRHHPERHPAGRHLERHDHRLQRAARPQGPGAGRRRTGRDPDLRDHLPDPRGHRERHARPARSRSSKRSSPATPRSARSSGCPGSAPSPAATCTTAPSPVARRSASSGRARSSGRAPSARCGASRTTSARSHAGFECGIGLTDFQDLKPGDIIETYEEREIPRT